MVHTYEVESLLEVMHSFLILVRRSKTFEFYGTFASFVSCMELNYSSFDGK